MAEEIKEYVKGNTTVIWKPNTCIHSGVCVGGLGKVFNPKNRPWIDVTQATEEEIRAQIDKCPSGALGYRDTE